MKKLETVFLNLLELYGPQNWWPADSDIEMIVGAILVQNTNWNNVDKALKNFKGNFDPDTILSYSYDELCTMIRPAGFYTRKAKTIINTLQWYQQYNFDVANTNYLSTHELRQQLLSVVGIGPETCDCILLYTFDRPVFVVDTYLKRFLENLGYPPLKSYQEYQQFIMDRISPDVLLYQELHAIIVEHGKMQPKNK